MQQSIDVIDVSKQIKVYHRGPPLNKGPLPSVFYFSLSGEESLNLDPFNQPAVFLSKQNLRVFSLTLPGHLGEFPHKYAIKEWAEKIALGKNIFTEFIEVCVYALDFLINKQYINSKHIGVAGLSRGAYIATQFAAKEERIGTILGFAPLTGLETMKDFESIIDLSLVKFLSLENFIPDLIGKTLRFYIGNYDTLVSTSRCFSFIHSLTEKSYQQKHQFTPVELIIYPSIGHKGHGTPREIFQDGSAWLTQNLISNCSK